MENESKKFKVLKKEFKLLNIPVYDLSDVMKNGVPSYLSKGKYLFWRDDTHWNNYGIFVAMKHVNKVINK